MVTDVSGIDDQSFNQSAWEGLMRAEKEFGITIAYKESCRDADYGPNIDTLTAAGYDLIWGLGFATRNAVLSAAQKHPDQKYGIVDFSYGPDTPANVCCVIFYDQGADIVFHASGSMGDAVIETARAHR